MYDFFYSSYYYSSQEAAQGFDILDILTVWPPFEGPPVSGDFVTIDIAVLNDSDTISKANPIINIYKDITNSPSVIEQLIFLISSLNVNILNNLEKIELDLVSYINSYLNSVNNYEITVNPVVYINSDLLLINNNALHINTSIPINLQSTIVNSSADMAIYLSQIITSFADIEIFGQYAFVTSSINNYVNANNTTNNESIVNILTNNLIRIENYIQNYYGHLFALSSLNISLLHNINNGYNFINIDSKLNILSFINPNGYTEVSLLPNIKLNTSLLLKNEYSPTYLSLQSNVFSNIEISDVPETNLISYVYIISDLEIYSNSVIETHFNVLNVGSLLYNSNNADVLLSTKFISSSKMDGNILLESGIKFSILVTRIGTFKLNNS